MKALFYTTSQAAERLGVSVRRVQAMIKSGMLTATAAGRDYLIEAALVERILDMKRPAGKPPKGQRGADRYFVDSPGEGYDDLVSSIQKFIKDNGLDAAMRAFAQASWQTIRDGVTTGLKRGKQEGLISAYGLLEENERPSEEKRRRGLPGADHVSEWLDKNGRPVKIISHPYHLTFEVMSDLVKYCNELGLRADVYGESWHFPGKTIRIEYTKDA